MSHLAIKVPSSRSLPAPLSLYALALAITMVSSLLSREICLLFMSRVQGKGAGCGGRESRPWSSRQGGDGVLMNSGSE